jgi:DNA-binding NtrC family response regulator
MHSESAAFRFGLIGWHDLPMNRAAMPTPYADLSSHGARTSETAVNPPAKRGELELVGHSAAIKRLRVQVQRIAPHFRSVLVRGERGSGKELVARMLHNARGVAGEPFLLRDAAAVEGWFRTEDRFGGFAEGTHKTTLFLDGVDRLSLPAQDWLLRMLGWQDSVLCSRRNLPGIEMRVIASTTDDLRTLAAAGRFRQELCRRLATVEIAVPPLRERMEDLSELAEYFLHRFGRLQGRNVPEIAAEAMLCLQEHHWPGNIRELSGVIRDAVLRSDGVLLREEDLTVLTRPGEVERVLTSRSASVRLQDVVERHVLDVLKGCGGNKLRAAELLGISRSTLYRMLETGSSAIAPR